MKAKNKLGSLTVVILAGGMQTRFLSVYDNIPKAMAPVGTGKRPHLEYLIEYLVKKGVGQIIISTGHLSESIEKNFASWSRLGVRVIVDAFENPGTGGALKHIIRLLLQNSDRPTRDIMYWNADTLVTVDPIILYEQHLQQQTAATIVLTNDNTAPNFGAARVFNQRIISFDENSWRHPKIIELNSFAHAGVGIIRLRPLLDILFGENFNRKSNICLFKDVLPEIVKLGAFPHISRGVFLEWGVPERYKKLLDNPDWISVAYAA